ncbi:short-chain dehydrogenase/reductase [Dyadobacter luteus]|uniref:Short-chain dehydrogenase/reductase n=1 Tax=Dyadobacter luteus TaxID=2259619 RepID=A0A3D8Y5T6_9BACT|nr:SDR family NAD(P)-dependent oxidoreductase [Dyadobacter luteus]REA58019.1 short-chain dehydrogenase/reductase [Dyadobacter luteus]
METTKVWLVTGASKGLGLALVKSLLQQNMRVAATSRNLQSLVSAIGEKSDQFLPMQLNITENEAVKAVIERTAAHFEKIDVVVNNAGYGQLGTLEELSDTEARENFDVNVFGPLNVIRHVMPYLRKQKSGHIFNIASVGGFLGNFPGWGIYCASKFAMAGFSEGLAEEVKEFGVHVTIVYPGYFRTDFLTSGSLKTPQQSIDEYTAARESEKAHLNQIDGSQPNDPEKAADVLIAVAGQPNPPVHLLLGVDAYDLLQQKTYIITQDAEKWKSYTISTGY